MSNNILGLLTSQKFSARGDRFENHRRKILHAYPQGGAPLTGLLTMVKEEETTDTKFHWYEKRYKQPRTVTRGAQLTTTAPSDGDDTGGSAVGSATLAVGTTYYLKVASTEDLRNGYVIELGGAKRIQLWITEVVPGVADPGLLGYVVVKPVRAVAHVAADTAAGVLVRAIGTAIGEGELGQGLKALGFKRPYAIMNQTEIFRTPFEFSGTVLKEGLKYDSTGPYRERAKDAIIEHMTSIERQILFGRRSTNMRDSFTSGQEMREVRTMSGIIEFLELWDAGSVGLDIDGATYNPYAFKGQSLSDDDDEKRIIENASGTVSVDKWNIWTERTSRYHSSRTSDKMVLCGSGVIMAMHKLFRASSDFSVTYGDSMYGLDFTTMQTPFGKYHFLTHPMFNEDPVWRYSALILDVWSLMFRPLTGRDTKLLKNRQNPGDDLRRDEYLTEAGLEFHLPEANMLIKNIRDFAA